ncbi:MAG: zinc-dependent metalloprotease [Acidobacteriota bacterium]|nr:zinc-dependent metalloprotease [Acidobacteriota bacterium]
MKLFALCVFALSACLPGQTPLPTPENPREAPAATPAAASAPLPGIRQADPDPKPYDKVITKDAKSSPGVFTVHKVKSKTYYEIPARELNKDFLWVSQISRTTLGVGYGGQAAGNYVVRWERKDNRILLRSVVYDVVADSKLPIAKAVSAANNDAILMAFNIETLGKNDAPVIEVTRLFTTEVPEFSPRARLRARAFDSSRSFLESVHAYPTNIEVEATQTFTTPIDPPTFGAGGPAPPNPFAPTGMRPGSATVLMHYSMVKLPDNPMMPRLFDPRVGFFAVRQTDYGQEEHRAPQRTYITRWRLEKKDPNAELSEPVKPITYYVDPATPAKWVPYIKAAIESWQPAFEAAGFKKGIIAKEAPTAQEDPYWSPEDSRYSVVRWLPSTIENAVGPHVHDPRTGEILDADIQLYHNVMQLSSDWYFVQASPSDKKSQTLPLSDDLMGRLIQYVVAHEVGHTLGFQHNMKSSSMYPAEKVRDREWVKKMGHVASLMDYSRFNYVAQPEDNIDPADLIPKIGPYDKWATMWGYKPIPGAHSPDAEKPILDEWAKAQDKTPWLRFSTVGALGSDPGENTEAVGDADAIYSTGLGLKNLNRVMGYLLAATTTRQGDPYDDLASVYGRVLGQWTLELNHVSAMVGGFDSQQKNIGQEGVRFTLVPRDKQAKAVQFLNANAFQTPQMFIRPDILRRIEPSGELDRIKQAQMRVLTSLLDNRKLARLEEQEALDGANAYRPTDFLADVRKGIWKELDSSNVKIDAYRRNLQRGYIELIAQKLNGRAAPTDDERPLLRGELKSLSTQIAQSLPKATDRETRLHLEDVRDQITKVLDPRFQPAAPAIAPLFGRAGADEETCWPDYAIK